MIVSGTEWYGRMLAPGQAEGEVLVLTEPLSFWGGFDAASGTIIDRRHPQCGISLAARIVALPASRGSSTSTSVLAEAIRLGTAPAAIILCRPDVIIALAPLVTRELYRRECPVVCLAPKDYAELRTGIQLRVRAENARAWLRLCFA